LRSTTDVLRRGFDSTLANWPLIAIRIAESILFLILIVGSIIAAIVPVAIAAGLSKFDFSDVDNAAEAFSRLVVDHWMLIFYVLAVAFVVLGVLMAIHAFVEAGCARVFVDAERVAGFRAFNMERWLRGGRTSWWAVFWIYNVAWGIAGLILLIPLLLTLVAMLLLSEPAPRVIVGCSGLAVSLLLLIPIGVIVGVWTQKAIAVCVPRAASASAALRIAWNQIRSDLGRHIAVAAIVIAVAFGGGMVLSMLTMPMSIFENAPHASPFVGLVFAPARIFTSFLQSIFSSAVGLWFLASYVSLTEEHP